MHNKSNKNDEQSIEMDPINNQSLKSSLLKPKNIQEKIIHTKRNSSIWKNNITHSIKHRRNLLSKIFTNGRNSLIEVRKHHHYILSEKIKHDKQHNIITINVSGNRYQTHLSTLENYPNTLLGDKKKRQYYWNENNNEYFFDRNRACFEAILYYYQSNGRLRRPDYVPLDTFLEEISFFDLGPQAISQINKLENVSIIKYIDLPNWFWRRYIWFYLEYPQNSIFGRIIYFISIILTLLSCLALAIETLPEYNTKWENLCKTKDNITLLNSNIILCTEIFSSPFFVIQTICVIYFIIEFILRLISTPSYLKFILSIYNWIDLGAILPYLVYLGFVLNYKRIHINERVFISFKIFQILRFLRVFRMYLIFKELKTLRVLSATLKESFIEFIIMIIILTVMAFLFGTATYFAEQDVNRQVFDSIPKATYWGILTITTLGYGDIYPVTVTGRILACTCAFFGVAISAMLVSLLVDRYQRAYNRKKYFPEQIIQTIDLSDSEHRKKQDFINRKLSRVKGASSNDLIFPSTPVPSKKSSVINKKYSGYDTSLSHIRFIITFPDDETNNTSMNEIANELMKELTEIIQNSGEQIHLKLINHKTNFSCGKTTRTTTLIEPSSTIHEETMF